MFSNLSPSERGHAHDIERTRPHPTLHTLSFVAVVVLLSFCVSSDALHAFHGARAGVPGFAAAERRVGEGGGVHVRRFETGVVWMDTAQGGRKKGIEANNVGEKRENRDIHTRYEANDSHRPAHKGEEGGKEVGAHRDGTDRKRRGDI